MRTTGLVSVGLARAEDLPAVRRFWFDVYCRQMKRFGEPSDDEDGQLVDPLDERSHIVLAREQGSGRVVGTLMSTVRSTGPLGIYDSLYGLDVSGLDHHEQSIATKFMVDEPYRRTDLGRRLSRLSYRVGLHAGVRRSFMDCNAHLIGFFLKLGYRPHLGWIDHLDFGKVFSMVLHLDDSAYLEAIQSAFLDDSYDSSDFPSLSI